jgi:hypothetical protein
MFNEIEYFIEGINLWIFAVAGMQLSNLKNTSLFKYPHLVFDQREPPARCIQDKIILEIPG